MSYEGNMLKELAMPDKAKVKQALLRTLFKHGGTIREFASGEEIVNEIADYFSLNEKQRNAALERIYRKENRVVKTPLWHRLLYRAADTLAKEKLITRPTTTVFLTNQKEWMLTEEGYDKALQLLNIPSTKKETLPIKSFEVQEIVHKLKSTSAPKAYNPVAEKKKVQSITKKTKLRSRGFRQAVVESYDYKCSICGLKINSPDLIQWEVQAAHVVPHSSNGKDDIWNGIALCHFHHWAFDVGWFALSDDFRVMLSSKTNLLSGSYGMVGGYDLFRNHLIHNKPVFLPKQEGLYPHVNSLRWHRKNIFANE